jgi:transcriptional regulator with XRE-family HTH domain
MAPDCAATDDETIGQVVREYRVAAGLTQGALAALAGVGEQTISYLERDLVRRPQHETLARLCGALNLSEKDRDRLERARLRQPPRQVRPTRRPGEWQGQGPVPLDVRAVPIVNIFVPLNEAEIITPPAHLVTLTGPSQETTTVARAAHVLFHARGYDNVYFVSLTGIDDAARLPGVILAAVTGVTEAPITASALLDYLRMQHLLLIFDRCEHLIESCAMLIDAIIRDCAAVCVLATSTEPLHIEGEIVRRIAPLA